MSSRSAAASRRYWRVDPGERAGVRECALPRLRVAQVWEAPVERSRYEYEWFRVAAAADRGPCRR